MAVLAVLPVHAIYAGFELRESLVALIEPRGRRASDRVWAAPGCSRYGWAIAAGLFTGLAILSRNTAMALAAACGLYGLIAGPRQAPRADDRLGRGRGRS